MLMGAVMHSVLNAFLLQHFLNVLGVFIVYYQSKYFLKDFVQKNEKLQSHLQKLDDQVQEMGQESSLMFMVSLRLFPGSPNAIYNYVFPHIPSLSMENCMLASFIGQAP